MALATVTTTAVVFSTITTTTVGVAGEVTADGGASVTARGICYGTSLNPTVAGSKVDIGTGTGVFTGTISGLTVNTSYHIRAYATNADGTAYGADVVVQTRIDELTNNIVKAEDLPTRVVEYSANIPFYRSMTISQKYMETDDEFAPIVATNYGVGFYPVPGYGAMYRIIADGVHTPTFSSDFKKSNASGDYDNTEHKLNLISFIYDGVDYWYNIIQPA